MGHQTETVQSKGIYHGLPVFSPDLKDLSAIVVGASGISGRNMLQVLAEAPSRWRKVYALSRRLPDFQGTNTEHVSVDLLKSPEDIAQVLRSAGVRADHVFFFAYLQPPPQSDGQMWSSVKELDDINGRLLGNTLSALRLADIEPQRILLQTGLKHYGSHLGPMQNPQVESDPRVPGGTNFYYTQEDILFKHCQGSRTQWNVTRPGWVLGAVKYGAMNIVYPLAVYAAVQRHRGLPLDFPGDYTAWDKEQDQSTAMLNCYLSEWAVLTPEAGNHAFNVCDSCPFSWGRFWPVLAGWYGIPWNPPNAEGDFKEDVMPTIPRGFGPKGRFRFAWSIASWAKDDAVQKTWADLAKSHGISSSPFDDIDRVFGPADFALATSWAYSISMSKARKMGWHGFVDSTDSIRAVLDDLEHIGMTPPVPNASETVTKTA